MKNWARHCGKKIREGNVKKGKVSGTYHLWKPEMESSSELPNLQYLGHKTEKRWLWRNLEQKENASKLPSVWTV
jgi:hypothetical protein